MKRIIFFFKNYRSLLRIKLKFNKPNKNKILLFDYTNESIFKRLIKRKIGVLYRRLEEINLYILFMAIKSCGFFNLGKSYIKTYIEYVEPKIIITFNELHGTFYLLKKLVKKNSFYTIAIQDGYRTLPNFSSFNLKNKKKYKVDKILNFSRKDKKLYENISNSPKVVAGSFRNNFYKKTKNIKNKKILLISQYRDEYKNNEKIKYFIREIKILDFLKTFCEKNNIKYLIATKPGVSKNNYMSAFNLQKNSEIISDLNFKKKYEIVDKSEVTIFADSSLGMEALSRGNKVISFPFKPYFGVPKFFWSHKINQDIFEKKLNLIYGMKINTWLKRINNKKEVFVKYNPGNTILLNIIKKYLKNKNA
jgi:surface carbohydrate biosynthesis protein